MSFAILRRFVCNAKSGLFSKNRNAFPIAVMVILLQISVVFLVAKLFLTVRFVETKHFAIFVLKISFNLKAIALMFVQSDFSKTLKIFVFLVKFISAIIVNIVPNRDARSVLLVFLSIKKIVRVVKNFSKVV